MFMETHCDGNTFIAFRKFTEKRRNLVVIQYEKQVDLYVKICAHIYVDRETLGHRNYVK